MSAELDRLTAEVAESKTVMASAKVLIEGMAARLVQVQSELAAIGVTNATLDTLAVDLDVSANDLAAAVAANTAAEEEGPGTGEVVA